MPSKNPSRRQFIRDGVILGGGVCTLALGACSLFDEPEMRVCSLDELQLHPYLISRFNRKKIFLTYLQEELVIFSLICRHKRCTVDFEEEEQLFLCPCHDGTYDRFGEVIDGPPPAPLLRFKYEIRGEEVWVLNQYEEMRREDGGQ
ncbi:MAG: Rieske (2Fe-2S) protein [Bacteroidota bacterium]